ncbi:neurotensin/neuromedin N [Pseudoliparis swirei]|uniref:neurotensin/neuromedin N n=1 Tax=Pseudoliparis swirei TaxID=2059687 RepID=UPI0024BE24AA|nr:neurotensin/neuromedin N [Pseudoliparis swirei]
MRAQVAFMLLLCSPCGGLCSDVEQEQRALEEELLGRFAAKMAQNRQSAPYWRVSLVNLCRMVNSLGQEAWSGGEDEEEEEEEEAGRELREGRSLQLQEELFNLHVICRALQSREGRLLHDAPAEDAVLKRKSPYILKRRAALGLKSRRPYILKRSAAY